MGQALNEDYKKPQALLENRENKTSKHSIYSVILSWNRLSDTIIYYLLISLVQYFP